MNIHYPEMNGPTPEADIVARVTFGGKFYIKTTLDLAGRGIRSEGTTTTGKNTYTVTALAMKKLDAEYSVVSEALLS